jgi:hypothetical protein
MPYSLAEAAAACGINRSTILRAIKAGKISAERNVHGQWQIAPAELHRVYPPAEVRTEGTSNKLPYRAHVSEAALAAEVKVLRDMLEHLKAQVSNAQGERDHWRAEADNWRNQAQAVRQLADATAARRSWWRLRRAG